MRDALCDNFPRAGLSKSYSYFGRNHGQAFPILKFRNKKRLTKIELTTVFEDQGTWGRGNFLGWDDMVS
jgi:hypothetical protein